MLSRYLARAWLASFGAAMLAATALYIVIDIFDRIGEVLPFSPAWTSVVAYFLFKLPKIVFDVFPAAGLLATLTSIGLLMRNREILAMRACGMSTRRIAAPIVACALLLSVGALFWNEDIVPVSSSRSRWLWDVELKRKVYRGVFDAASVWFQTDRGFLHIRRYDADKRVISGLALYEADPDFGLRRVTEVDSMTWQNGAWVSSAGFVKELGGDEMTVRPLAPGEFRLEEDPENLAARKRRPEEFSSGQLREQIAQLEARGVGAGELAVDLHSKIAWPFSGFFVALLGVPVALREGRGAGLARSSAVGVVIGFGYWIVTGLALSAGRTGGLSPIVAAWFANSLCVVASLVLYAKGGAR